MEFSAENSQWGAGVEFAAAPEAFPGTVTPEQLQPGQCAFGWARRVPVPWKRCEEEKSMRLDWTLAIVALLSGSLASAARKNPDARQLAYLEARAAQAAPGEQCLLYAELVNASTDVVLIRMQGGADEQALTMLRSIQGYVSRIDPNHAKSAKTLKNAEIILDRAAFKLKELLLSVPFEDRPLLEHTLEQMNEAQSAVLLQVFAH